MRIAVTVQFVLLFSIAGCSQHQPAGPIPPVPEERGKGWPQEWSALVGQTVTLEGEAVNAKLGALLQGKEGAIWIEGLDSWPDECLVVGERGKHLRVTGTVIKQDDVPVFVQRPGELPRAGIPVQSEEELERAKWRYLLKDAKWTVLE
jgi:hypothetical protein